MSCSGQCCSGSGAATTWRSVLRRAAAATCASDVEMFRLIVTQHPAEVRKAYEDFFFIATRAKDAPNFVAELLSLDAACNDTRMARTHVRFLMNIPALGIPIVSSVCRHYSRAGILEQVIEQHGSTEFCQDYEYRPNIKNVLISPMRKVVHDNTTHAENFAEEIIQIFLDNGININNRYKLDYGQSALHYAAYNNLWKCVKLLINSGANVDFAYEGITTRQLIENRMMGSLLLNTPTFKSEPNDVTLPLFTALYDKNEEQFRNIYLATLTQHKKYKDDDWNLICQHAPLSFLSEFTSDSNLYFNHDDGWCTLLQLACLKNLPNAVRTILEIDPNPDRTSGLKDHALLIAAEKGFWDVVLILVKHGCDDNGNINSSAVDVNVKGDFGDTALIKIARAWVDSNINDINVISNSLIEIIETLDLRGELNVNYVNKRGDTALKLSIKSTNKFLFSLLIKKGAFLGVSKDLLRDIRYEDLDNMFNSTLSSGTYKGHRFVNIDFECLYLQYEIPGIPDYDIYPEMLPLYKLSRSKNHKAILAHPLVTSFLDLKWLKFCWIYLLNLLLYLCFVVSLTCHVYLMNDPEGAPISLGCTLLFWTYLLVRELLQLTMSYSEYFATLENWLELFILVGTIVMLQYAYCDLATLIVLATYAEFSLLLGRHPKAATYIAMFLRVSRVNALLLALSSPVIFAFATCFSLLLRDNDHFQNASLSSFKTLIMLAGEFELAELKFDSSPILGRTIFILFVVAIAVILMNLLNALAVSDTEAIRRDAEIISLQAKIELFTKIESAVLGYPMDWYVNSWGPFPDSKFWHYVFLFRLKLRGILIDASLLPLSEHNKFILSVREDGKVMEKFTTENGKSVMKKNYALNIDPKSRILKIISKYILGVNMRRIFDFSYYFAVCLEHSADELKLQSQVLDLKQEIRRVRDESKKNINVLQDLKLNQNSISNQIRELNESVVSHTKEFEDLKKNILVQNSTLQNQISDLAYQIKLMSEIFKVRSRAEN